MSFVEKVGKLVRLLRYKKEGLRGDNGVDSGSQQVVRDDFIDCSLMSYQQCLSAPGESKADTDGDLDEELTQLPDSIHKLLFDASMEMWPTDTTDLGNNKNKVAN